MDEKLSNWYECDFFNSIIVDLKQTQYFIIIFVSLQQDLRKKKWKRWIIYVVKRFYEE